MSHAKYVFLALFLVAFVGCNRPAQESATQQQAPAAAEPTTTQSIQSPAPAESEPQASAPSSPAVAETRKAPAKKAAVQPTSKATTAPSATSSKTEPETETSSLVSAAGSHSPAIATKPAEPRYATIAGGVTLPVRLQTPLDTSVNKSGDTFSAVLDKDIIVDGNVVVPRGSTVEGKLSHVERAGRVEGRAAMSLQLTSLEVDGKTYALHTDILAVQAESTKKQDATKVGIGAGLGAVIGAIAGGGKGAAIGAAVGAGAGGATVIATRGKEIKFDVEQKLNFVLREDIRIRLQ